MKPTDFTPLEGVNRKHLQQHFSQAAPSYDEAAILQKTVAERVEERLQLTKLDIKHLADIGAGTGLLTEKLQRLYPQAHLYAVDFSLPMLQTARQRLEPKGMARSVLKNWLPHTLLPQTRLHLVNADAYQLPFADGSLDLLTSNLMLQWCDDLDSVFREFRRVLRPNGMLMFTSFGPDTLKELRRAWHQADPEQTHVNHFIDMHDLGDALIRAGFGQPVMDVEHFTLTYDQPMGVLRDLKAIGATHAAANRSRGLMGKARFQAMLNAYEQARHDSKIPATYEVVHGHAWASREILKGPNRDRSGLVEISLETFAKQTQQKHRP
ncbi:MAG: malonyl-ACP O-methyltransferase BioC [Thiotrichales bacterium]|nr:malonyl-ACP O-methyltransferase BioC [Thiotrichales bacterium]